MTTGDRYDITLIQREDFDLELELMVGETEETLTPIDLESATFEGHVREDWNGPLLAEFTFVIVPPATEAGRPTVRASLSGDAILAIAPGERHYDIFANIGGKRSRIIYGAANIEPAQTRP